MFCQNCGNTMIEGLSYCNRCGSRATGGSAIEPPVMMATTGKPTGIVITLSIVTGLIVLSGLGMLFPLLIILLKSNIKPSAVVMITLMFLGTLFGISWLLIQQISRAFDFYFKRDSNQLSKKSTPPQQQPVQLFNRNTGQIEGAREPFISVTENTTRTLDSAFQEKKL
jgi:hypothetical protein